MDDDTPSFGAKVWRNSRIVISAVGLVIFFFAISGLLRKITGGSETYTTYGIALLVSLVLFGCDGDLGELVGRHSVDYAAVAAVSAGGSGGTSG